MKSVLSSVNILRACVSNISHIWISTKISINSSSNRDEKRKRVSGRKYRKRQQWTLKRRHQVKYCLLSQDRDKQFAGSTSQRFFFEKILLLVLCSDSHENAWNGWNFKSMLTAKRSTWNLSIPFWAVNRLAGRPNLYVIMYYNNSVEKQSSDLALSVSFASSLMSKFMKGL